MACFGSDSARLLEELMQNCSASKKRKKSARTTQSAPTAAVRKRRKGSQGLEKWLEMSCVMMESSPDRSPSPEPECLSLRSFADTSVRFRRDISVQFDLTKESECFRLPALDFETVESVIGCLEGRGSLDIRACHERLLSIHQTADRNETWTSKYAPTDCFSLLGNDTALLTLKSWLNDWKLYIAKNAAEEAVEKSQGSKKTKKTGKFKKEKGSSRRHCLDSSDEEAESDEYQLPAPEEMPLTGFMVYGPPGVGKTAAMHALAKELGFTVLEINPASCKDAKQILIQSLEATQSHRVHGAQSTTAAPFLSQPQSQRTKDVTQRSNTLILIDDADVLPEGEESFLHAIEAMLKKSKRPVIFTISGLSKIRLIQTESLECGDLDFLRQPLIDVACYVTLVALAESIVVNFTDALAMVESAKGDLRASLNLAQFLMSGVESKSVVGAAKRDDTIVLSDTTIVETLPSDPWAVLPEVEELMNFVVGKVCIGDPADHIASLDSGCGSCCSSQPVSAADSSASQGRRSSLRPDSSDAVADQKRKESHRILTQACFDAEMRSQMAGIFSDSTDGSNYLSENLPLAGVTEDAYEEAGTVECRLSSLARSSSLGRVYAELLSSLCPTSTGVDHSHLSNSDALGAGRLLYHRYGQFNPQTHVRGYQFGFEQWSFVRAMAQSEVTRRQMEERVKRRRVRFYNYLGPTSLQLSEGLISRLARRIGEVHLQGREGQCG